MKPEDYFNEFNLPPVEPSPVGEEVYTWTYRDPQTGKIKTESKNVIEEVQSYAGQVDYKKFINMAQDGSFEYVGGQNDRGVYLDTTALGGNSVSVDEFAVQNEEEANKIYDELRNSKTGPGYSGPNNGGQVEKSGSSDNNPSPTVVEPQGGNL